MAEVYGSTALKREGSFRLEDWRLWPENERWELIGGTAYAMSPAPRVGHQRVALALAVQLSKHLEGKPCEAFIAPMDVFLEEGGAEESVVEPDVMVVCDPGKVAEDGIHGAPDFVAEILSEHTAYKDLGDKKRLYERSGVREYWIIHPKTGSVTVYLRGDSGFTPAREYQAEQSVPSAAVEGFAWKRT